MDIRKAIREAEFGDKNKAKVMVDSQLGEIIFGKDIDELLEGYEVISQMNVNDDQYWYKVGSLCCGVQDYWSIIFALEHSIKKDNFNLGHVYKAIIAAKLELGLENQIAETCVEGMKALLKEVGFDAKDNAVQIADRYCDSFEFNPNPPDVVGDLDILLRLYELHNSEDNLIKVDFKNKKRI